MKQLRDEELGKQKNYKFCLQFGIVECMWHGEKTSKQKYDENEARDVTSIDF